MNYHNKSIVYFFLYLLPPLIILSVVYYHFYRVEIDDINQQISTKELTYIQHQQQLLLKDLSRLGSDALFLAEHQSLLNWFRAESSEEKRNFEQDLQAFVRYNNVYDQASVLDVNGIEKFRVNSGGDEPELVREGDLQDKSHRHYFKSALALPPGRINVSSMDLNMERGIIELPYKPVLRVSTPVYNASGEVLGVVVLNFLGQRILSQLEQQQEERIGEFWILNKNGYWLLHQNQELLWGFQLSGKEQNKLEVLYPEVYRVMNQNPARGQFKTSQGLITYKTIDMSSQEITSVFSELVDPEKLASLPQWTFVSRVSEEKLLQIYQAIFTGLLKVYLLMVGLIGISAGFLAHRQFAKERYLATVEDSEKQFRSLLNAAPDPFVIVDEQGVIKIVNQEALKKFGYSREELVGQPIEILVPISQRQSHQDMRNAYLQSPMNRSMGEGRELYGMQKSGDKFPVEISLSPSISPKSFFVISIIRDISARKKAEAERLLMEARYRYLVDNLPVGVFRCEMGEHAYLQDVNPELRHLLALPADIAGQKLELSQFLCTQTDWTELIDSLLKDGKVNGREIRMRDLNQEEFYASITASLYTDEENHTALNGLVENINERKEQEEKIRHLNEDLRLRSSELETINRELESFSYSVSHDLRAPLRAMDGFSRTLLQEYSESLDQRGKDRLERIRNASQRMGQLIDDLLNLSRVSRTQIKWQEVDVSSLAREIADELKSINPERVMDISIKENMQFYCDKHLLRIVLNNLIGNAWKFTSKCEHAKVEVGLTGEQDQTLFVRDNGAGFDMEYANKLFGAFQRLHDAHEYPGTGIGLATVQRIINKHGGRIWAESQVGDGATFYITLAHNNLGDSDE